MRSVSQLLAGAFCVALTAATPAFAIECDGNFQVQKSGAYIATPYCQDNYLAKVAREYGARVSAQVIRWNTGEKAKICRLVGYDNRVRDTCAPYLDGDRFKIWR